MRRIIIPAEVSQTFELIPINSAPIREQWVKRYRLLEKKLEKLKREWRMFEEEAFPHYQKWYYKTFWEELNKVNDWTERAREQQRLVMAIRAHQEIYRLDEMRAYLKVRERLKMKLDPFPDQADVDAHEAKIRAQREAARKREEEIRKRREEEAKKFWDTQEDESQYSEDVASAYARMFEQSDDARVKAEEAMRAESSRNAKPEKREDDLKTLYRAIVRELHPDTGHEMSSVEKDWWNQAQVAYRNGDLEMLRMLALKIQGAGKVVLENIDEIGMIIDLCVNLVEQQDEIELQKRRMRKDPVYRFWMSRTRPASRDKLVFELKHGLSSQFRRLKDFVFEVRSRLSEIDHATRYYDEGEDDAEFDPRARRRAPANRSKNSDKSSETSNGRGRGRGRGR